MKKRSLAVLMATAMVVSSLVACGGGSSSGGGTSTTAAAAETTAAATSEPAVLSTDQAQATGEDVTLRVSLWDYSNTEYYKNMFNAFMEKYPTSPLM